MNLRREAALLQRRRQEIKARIAMAMYGRSSSPAPSLCVWRFGRRASSDRGVFHHQPEPDDQRLDLAAVAVSSPQSNRAQYLLSNSARKASPTLALTSCRATLRATVLAATARPAALR